MERTIIPRRPLHIGRQRCHRFILKCFVIEILYKRKTLFHIAVHRLHNARIIGNCVLPACKAYYQKILLARLQQILDRQIRRNLSFFLMIGCDVGIRYQTLRVKTAYFIRDRIHFGLVSLYRHRQYSLGRNRSDRIPHISRVHLRRVAVQFIDLHVPRMQVNHWKNSLLHLCRPVFVGMIHHSAKYQ